MTTQRNTGSVLAWTAAAGFIATAALHSTGIDSATRLAQQMPEEIRPLIPALWLAFSIDLIVVGLIIAVVARHRGPGSRLILAFAAICPLAAAGLQLLFIGFVPPTAILLGIGIITLAAALLIQVSGRKAPAGGA